MIPAEGQMTDLPADQQVLLILTTLKYNKTFMNRLNDIERISIGFFHSDSKESLEAKAKFSEVFEKSFKHKTFYSRSLVMEAISDVSSIKAGKFNVLIIGPGAEAMIPDILNATRENKIVSATGVTAYMNSGITLVVGLQNNRKFLGINLKNSMRENCRFSPTILQLAIIIDKQ